VPLLRRALWERQRRLGTVEDGLDVVAVGVVYERSVVVLVVARPESGRAIVRRPGVERRRVESIDRCPIWPGERSVQRCRRLALSDEEVNAARRPPADASFKLDFLDAERCERLPVEAPARLGVPNRNRKVVDEDLGF